MNSVSEMLKFMSILSLFCFIRYSLWPYSNELVTLHDQELSERVEEQISGSRTLAFFTDSAALDIVLRA